MIIDPVMPCGNAARHYDKSLGVPLEIKNFFATLKSKKIINIFEFKCGIYNWKFG